MKSVETTNGYTVYISECDVDLVSGLTLYAKTRTDIVVGVNCVHKGRTTVLSRVLLGISDGRYEVDHLNGNPLDNTRGNIRVCTRQQNLLNKSKYKNNKSGYKGVYLRKDTGLFRAELNINKKRYRSDGHKTAKEAAAAYNKLAKKFHGIFANLNKL